MNYKKVLYQVVVAYWPEMCLQERRYPEAPATRVQFRTVLLSVVFKATNPSTLGRSTETHKIALMNNDIKKQVTLGGFIISYVLMNINFNIPSIRRIYVHKRVFFASTTLDFKLGHQYVIEVQTFSFDSRGLTKVLNDLFLKYNHFKRSDFMRLKVIGEVFHSLW